LTGASAKTWFTNKNMNSRDKKETFLRMLDATEKSFIMGASTGNVGRRGDALNEKIGICGNHAYSLLGVFELQRSSSGYRLLRKS